MSHVTHERQPRERGTHRLDPASRPSQPESDRAPVLAEALAYMGSAIVLAGVLLLVALFWDDLSTALRLSLTGAAAASLVIAGLLLRGRPGTAGARLRSVLWFVAAPATAAFLTLLGWEALDLTAADTAVLSTAGTCGLATLLWLAHRAPLQQVAMMVSAMAVAGTLIGTFVADEGLPGVGVWAVGACWMLLGWAALLRPARLAMALGAASLVIGAQLTMVSDLGVAFAVGSVLAVLIIALLSRDLVLVAIAALASVAVLPVAVIRWFPGQLAGPVALLTGGLVVVGLAVAVFRQGGRSTRRTRGLHRIQPRTALLLSSTAVLGSLGVVIAAALA